MRRNVTAALAGLVVCAAATGCGSGRAEPGRIPDNPLPPVAKSTPAAAVVGGDASTTPPVKFSK